MPRIRYLKKYQRIEVEYEDDDEDNSRSLSGESWLSNKSIISTIDTAKLKQAISYHRAMANTMEQELASRTSTNYVQAKPILDETGRTIFQSVRRNQQRNSNARKNRGLFRGLKLTPKLKKELLECLKNSI